MRRSVFNKALIWLCSSTLLLFSSSLLLAGGDYGDNFTWNKFSSLEIRIQKYAELNHALPSKLSDLPVDPERDDTTTDGWSKPITYSPQKDGSVILTSPGKNGGEDIRSHQFSMCSEDERYNEEFWTFNHIDLIESRVRDYAKERGHLPPALSNLTQEGMDTLDGWGKPIEFKVTSHGTVTLTSRGKNGTQIFRNEFYVKQADTTNAPAMGKAKVPELPLNETERRKLMRSILGHYSAKVNEADVPMTVDEKTINCTVGSTTFTYQYQVIGASGNTLVVKFIRNGSPDQKRATITLESGNTLHFNGTDDPRLAYEWAQTPQK